MALSDYKITQEETAANGVVSAPDVLTGTAQENKAVFDKLINQTVMVKHNGLIDELSTSGAGDTGITDIPGLVAETVQEALEEINANVGEIIDPNNPETAGKLGFTPFPNVAATNVQDAVEEVQRNLETAVAEIQADVPTASEVPSNPFPGVTSDNVQGALEELNGKVEDIQAGVIPSGSITGDMIQDGAVTADKLGSDVTGDTIPTSASDPTSISSQLSNKVDVNPGWGNDLFGNNLNDWKRLGTFDTIGNNPDPVTLNVPPETDGWGIVTVSSAKDTEMAPTMQLFNPLNYIANKDRPLFYRFFRNTWTAWKPIAIATPPEKTSLPLVGGVSNLTEAGGLTSTFSKDQFGKVHVFAAVQGQLFGNASRLFTLPEDCRPPESIAINAYTNSQYNAFVKIGADGIGQIFFGNGGATCTNVVASGDFYAAQ